MTRNHYCITSTNKHENNSIINNHNLKQMSVSHTMVNSFLDLIHTVCHTMGAGHARSYYLNNNKEDAKARASIWSLQNTCNQIDKNCT